MEMTQVTVILGLQLQMLPQSLLKRSKKVKTEPPKLSKRILIFCSNFSSPGVRISVPRKPAQRRLL